MLYELSFPSVNKRDAVQAWYYVPPAAPKGIIQLVHGFGEHSRRYLHMIVKFVEAGYIVVSDDHVGHGKTALQNDTWGDWGDAGYFTMRDDEHALKALAQEKFGKALPYFVFGHSMGSVIVRQLIAAWGDEFKAAVLCGTCGDFPTDEARSMYQRDIEAGRGQEMDEEAAAAFFGWMNERCAGATVGNEWICHDEYVQKDHADDPFDAFLHPVTNQSMLYFIEMIDAIKGVKWAQKVPQDLPIFNIYGDEDPFGLYGIGPNEVAGWLAKTGHTVENKTYNGKRHEIHNYPDIRDDVEQRIIAFFTAALEK